jgi:RimJ/RimL family protein N-acetyltransferase
VFGPILRGESISLEPPQPEYLDTYRGWLADLDVTRYLLVRFPPSEKQEEEWYERQASSEATAIWAIVLEGRPIGSTGLHNIDWINRHASSGMLIGDRSQWGKGYASQAVALRTAFAFRELGLERLETESFAVNAPMHRALEKSGYRKIGLKRRYAYRGGVWHDAYIFELLRDEWLARES